MTRQQHRRITLGICAAGLAFFVWASAFADVLVWGTP